MKHLNIHVSAIYGGAPISEQVIFLIIIRFASQFFSADCRAEAWP